MKIQPIEISQIAKFGANAPLMEMEPLSEHFAAFLKENIRDLSSKLDKSEKFAKLATVGDVELHELAVHMSETELKLKTLITIRDSLVSLIQELNRTQI